MQSADTPDLPTPKDVYAIGADFVANRWNPEKSVGERVAPVGWRETDRANVAVEHRRRHIYP